jgi:hypothetical protein
LGQIARMIFCDKSKSLENLASQDYTISIDEKNEKEFFIIG